MPATIWDELGIAETDDERAIKRAYAARLRVTSPESDPAGYMKLREAFEAAKSHAAMLRYRQEQEEPAEVAAQPAPVVPVEELPPPSPQQQAFEELWSLLSIQKHEEFLEKVASIRASTLFATLDEQQDFVGGVAVLVQRAQVTDTAWLGRLAETLGAREHDNVFPPESGYGYAYQALLDCLGESRNKTALAQATGHDELASTPGYLHVYHVLTAPFDSERLVALTRSRTYHRLAESILARSNDDPVIVIPAENREWWERTAMAGQHKPMSDELPAAPEATTEDGSWRLVFWVIWIFVVLGFNAVRGCSDHPKYSTTSSRTTPVPTVSNPQSTVMDMKRTLRVSLDGCDSQTRVEIYSRVFQLRRGRLLHEIPLGERIAEENDPVVVSLLQKCQPPSP